MLRQKLLPAMLALLPATGALTAQTTDVYAATEPCGSGPVRRRRRAAIGTTALIAATIIVVGISARLRLGRCAEVRRLYVATSLAAGRGLRST